jgi:hypothetical protein
MSDDKNDGSNVSNVLSQIAEGTDIINNKEANAEPEIEQTTQSTNIPSFDNVAPVSNIETGTDEEEELTLQEKLLKNKIPLLVIFIVWVIGMFVVLGPDAPDVNNEPTPPVQEAVLDSTFEVGAEDTNFVASPVTNNEVKPSEDNFNAPVQEEGDVFDSVTPQLTMDGETSSDALSSIENLDDIIEKGNRVSEVANDLEDLSPPSQEFIADNNVENPVASISEVPATLTLEVGAQDTKLQSVEPSGITISSDDFTSLVDKIDSMATAQNETIKEVKSLKWQIGKLSNASKFKVAPVLKVITTVPAAKNCAECVSHARVDFDDTKKLVGNGDMLFGYTVDINGDRLNLLDDKKKTVFSYWVEK